MARHSLTRFKVKEPEPHLKRKYFKRYHGRDFYLNPHKYPDITSKQLFDEDRALVLEIGSGRGTFLVDFAGTNRRNNYLGMEYQKKAVWDSINKAHSAGLSNIRFIYTDARNAIHKVPENSVYMVYVMFPPPFVNSRDKNKDLLGKRMLDEYGRVLSPAGSLHFFTDDVPYYQQVLKGFEDHADFAKHDEFYDDNNLFSDYKRFWETRGIPTNRASWRRK